jgi:hypothetical protein
MYCRKPGTLEKTNPGLHRGNVLEYGEKTVTGGDTQ